MVDRLDTLRRLNTWAGAIAQHLRPDAPIAYTAEGLRIGRKGSLSIKTAEGWYDHEAGKGGPDTLTLIQHLKNCTAAPASVWARDWLDTHPGDGELNAEGAAEAAAEAGERRSAWARQILDEAIDPTDTPAATYLESRGIASPYPSCVRFLPDARTGEGAVVGILTTATGEAVGAQVGYLDPQGRKSTVQPQRQLFFIEKNDQAAFRISAAEPVEAAVPLAIVEGLEDALSIAQAGAAHEVLGIPGVGRFSKFDLPADSEVVVFRDGDAVDSAAAKQLGEAVDRWLLAGARVRLTATPEAADANSILQEQGVEELKRLIAEAAPAELSFNADVVRLSALEPVQYERERAGVAKRHDVRVGFLDAAVKAARAEAEAAAAEDDEDESPYPEPVADIAPVLDQALAELQRYVVASEPDLAAAVLWSLHAHLVHHEKVWIAVSPRLAIQAPDRNCGKSTLLEALGALTPRPETGSSITASVVFRLIEARKPTLLLDEADRILRSSNDELIAVLNSSHRRAGAFVWRTEEVAGQRVPVKFNTWSPCAFAGIRELPPTLQDRSIVIRLARAKPGEVKAHLRNGSSPTLRTLKRRFARWTADLVRLPDLPLPAGLHNRAGDNWQALLSLATLAGGRWPQLVKEAALASLVADQQESVLVGLLDGIKRAFGEQERLSTRAMLDFLLADDEHDWTTANRGRPVNEAFLRERLRGVIAPAADGKPGSEQWRSGRIRERGYTRSRFVDAWQRYLSKSAKTTRDTYDNRDTASNPRKGNGKVVTDMEDVVRDTAPHPGQGNGNVTDTAPRHGCEKTHPRRKKSTKSKAVTDGPSVTGDYGGNEGMPPTNGGLGEEEIL